MRKLNILQIISSHHLTGAAAPALALSATLTKSGHNVLFLCGLLKKNLISNAEKLGVRAVTLPYFRRSANPVKNLVDITQLSKIIVENKIELIHCHLTHDHWISALSCFISGIKLPLVRTVHSQRYTGRRLDYRILYSGFCSVVTTISQFHKSLLLKNLNIEPGKIRVINGSVNTNYFNPSVSPQKIREEFSIAADCPVIGLVSSFKSGRGHELILNALALLKNKYNGIRLILAGKGENVQRIKEMVDRLNLKENVIFAGYRKNDLPCLYAALDIPVLLAEGNDGSCRAALEAMACGKAVVAFSFGAVNEIISDGFDGLIAKNQDFQDLVEKLMILLEDKTLREKMGRGARAKAEKFFDNEIEGREYERLYMELLS